MLDKSKYFLNKNENKITLEETKNLQEIILYHDNLYYNKENPIISDFEYDILLKKLNFLEEKYDLEKISSNIGADLVESTFEKVPHSKPMLSLDNTYNAEDLTDFDKKIKNILKRDINLSYNVEYKFDGLGIELIYEKGNFIQAITRGNGLQGEDVTENVRQIENIPKKIDYKNRLEVRGEVVMLKSIFKKVNEERLKNSEALFSNPRNAASGSLRQKNINITRDRKLFFFAYDVPNFEEEEASYRDLITHLENTGFSVSPFFEYGENIEKITEIILDIQEKKSDLNLDFEIDGLVLKLDNISLWREIGFTGHHPRYATSYKFPAELLTTKILSIEESVGRTGTITPVANLESVNIGGVIVKRATLHNYDEVKNKDIKIGDNVFIRRAGEVIPEVVSVITEGRTGEEKEILPPEKCPICDTKVKKDEDKVRYYCDNPKCPAKTMQNLAYQIGKTGLNIDGFGPAIVEKFLEEKLITDLPSIFNLKDKKEEILALEGFQEKSVNNLLEAIENAKNIGVNTFITTLGISGVGKVTAREVAKLFKVADDIINFNYNIEDLLELNDVGPEIAKNIVNFFHNPDNEEFLEKLISKLNIEFPDKNNNNNAKLLDKKFCVTGSFDNYKRDELVKIIEENGGEFFSSVSGKLDYLLAGEKAGSKIQKAEKLGVEILSLEEFFDLIK
ncbi:MAG: NAD-dependent DNA ligase LigA [Candidatus Gracilibacteria bacterium]|nr:NAD-dependent DNA ligase LigA [Candidatus Gracilibacteria bacterium]